MMRDTECCSVNSAPLITIMESFPQRLLENLDIAVFLPTPLGPYNPDWAVLVEKDGTERLYFVVETKSSLFTDELRDKESAKIKCGEAHFKALAVGKNPAKFKKATKVNDLLE